MEWRWVELGRVTDIIMGQSPPGETYNDEGVGLPFFQGKADFGDQYPTTRKWCSAPNRVAEPGDILLSVRAPVGPTNVARERCCIGRGLAAIRANRSCLDGGYLRFYFKQAEEALSRRGQGSTFSAINRAEIEALQIPLPPLSEQRRIVKILDQADRLRRLRAQADAKADRILPALFIKMFGDPATNPMGWPVKAIGQIVSIRSGGTPSKSKPEFWDGNIPWVSPKDMNTELIIDARDHISLAGLEHSATRLIPPRAVLVVVRSGILAHSFPVALTGVEVAINQDIKALVPSDGVLPEYLFALLRCFPSIGLSCVKTGATVHNVSTDKFRALEIPLPPVQRQEQFAAVLGAWVSRRSIVGCQRQKLDRCFDVLVHAAFNGSLTASWREAHMKELLQEMEQQASVLEAART